MSTAWIMTAEVAEAFFELCLMREAVTEPERVAILQEIVDEGRAECFSSTASKEEIITTFAKHYNLYHISKRDKNQH